MQRLTTFLPDVNVWLALASRRHVHAEVCSGWLNDIDNGEVAFCRVTQMGFLRLLTHQSVMGNDVLSSRKAWGIYRTILADERVQFAPEPFEVEREWSKLTMHDRATPKIWSDAYLVAFACAAGMQIVTLDRGMLSLDRRALLLI
jgi:uncharacterized protein